jgi:AcrR family transcriptional regulator
MRRTPWEQASGIIEVSLELLDKEGYEAFQVRTVAKRARVSLATIYNLFGTRDQLVVAAVQRWLDVNAYEVMSPPEPGESPYETLMRVLRTVFEPWERHPNMLKAYHRARSSPGGDGLVMHGLAIVRPIAEAALEGADPRYLDDLGLIFGHVLRAVIARFADGEISIEEVLPILERTLFRLMTDNELGPARARPRALRSQGTARNPTGPKAKQKGANPRKGRYSA